MWFSWIMGGKMRTTTWLNINYYKGPTFVLGSEFMCTYYITKNKCLVFVVNHGNLVLLVLLQSVLPQT